MYSPADDWRKLKLPGQEKVIVLELGSESRGAIYMTIYELAPHGDESVEVLVNDEIFYHAGDLTVPARSD